MTLSRLLGFGAQERAFIEVHHEARVEIRNIAYMYVDRCVADGKVKGFKSYFYILNNMFRNTINPKDGAALDLNGYARNLLARMAPGGERFNVPRFLWMELQVATNDARKGQSYAPYLMFIIDKVTRYTFPKDGLHEPNKRKKTHHVSVSEIVWPSSTTAVVDRPKSSRSSSHQKKKKSRVSRWTRAIFSTCSYAAMTTYEACLEVRELHDKAELPPLDPSRAPQEDILEISGDFGRKRKPFY